MVQRKRPVRMRPTVGSVVPLGAAGAKLLASVPLFAGLPAKDLRRVAALAEETWFSAGRIVVQQGKAASSFYVILDGRARVTRGRSGRTIRKLKQGDHFGELALLAGGPRTATVIADTTLDTVRISRPAFRRLLLEQPEIGLRIMSSMAKRLQECEKQFPA